MEPSAWFQQHKYQPPPRPSPGCHEMSLHSCCFCWSETQLIVMMMMMMTRECVPQLGMELDFDLCFLHPAAPGPGVLDGFSGTEKTTDQYKEQGKDKGKS